MLFRSEEASEEKKALEKNLADIEALKKRALAVGLPETATLEQLLEAEKEKSV